MLRVSFCAKCGKVQTMTPDEMNKALLLAAQLLCGNVSVSDQAFNDQLLAGYKLVTSALKAGTPLYAIDIAGNAQAALLIAQIRSELYPNGEVIPASALAAVTPSIVAEQELAAKSPLNLLAPAPKPVVATKPRKKSFWEKLGEGLKAIASDPVGYVRGRVETPSELHNPGNGVDQVVTGLATGAVNSVEGATATAVEDQIRNI